MFFSIISYESNDFISVYPNPTNSILTINTKAIYSSIQIVNTFVDDAQFDEKDIRLQDVPPHHTIRDDKADRILSDL